jgi:hypothetical protein
MKDFGFDSAQQRFCTSTASIKIFCIRPARLEFGLGLVCNTINQSAAAGPYVL